jgi:hypothetical protein
MSANMIVSWRCSARPELLTLRGEVVSAAVAEAPQSRQNFLPGGFSPPHLPHSQGSGDPQSPQNFPPTAFDPHCKQIIARTCSP